MAEMTGSGWVGTAMWGGVCREGQMSDALSLPDLCHHYRLVISHQDILETTPYTTIWERFEDLESRLQYLEISKLFFLIEKINSITITSRVGSQFFFRCLKRI